MARREARIHTSIWDDEDFLALSGSAQRLYFVLLSQRNLSLCGVLALTIDRWARFCAGGTVKAVRAALTELGNAGYVVVDRATEEAWVRTFVKHDGVLDKPNVVIAMARDFSGIHSQPIREGFLEGLPEGFLEGLPEGYAERLDEGFSRAYTRSLQSPSSSLLPPKNEPTRSTRAKSGFGSIADLKVGTHIKAIGL
jgi:hypothetical protein